MSFKLTDRSELLVSYFFHYQFESASPALQLYRTSLDFAAPALRRTFHMHRCILAEFEVSRLYLTWSEIKRRIFVLSVSNKTIFFYENHR